MSMYEKVSTNLNFVEREKQIETFWKTEDIFKKSMELMKGNMWRLFHLEFSFLPLILLSFLTCGIGLLWLMPYMHMASTNFYLDLVNPQQSGSNVDLQV